MIEIFILSIIQGVTEFLPVSSSSHLILISEYINFESHNLSVDVSLHIGSFLAVITYFKKDIKNFLKNKDLFLKIIISSIPVMIFGFFLVKYNLIDQLRNIKVIAWATIIFGILLLVTDKMSKKNKIEKNFNFKSAVFIGTLQILSLIPGVSRAGIAITASRILKFNRVDSSKISFLLSIPALFGASILGLKDLTTQSIDLNYLALLAIFFSFLFSYMTVKFFLIYINKFSMNVFVFYRILLAMFLFYIIY